MLFAEAAVHEQKSVLDIPLERNDVVVFDRGYTDFGWYRTLVDKGVSFVTRLKKNADYKVIERRSVKHLKDIYSDQIIELKGFHTKQKYPYLLRRIRCKDSETGNIIVILTNQFNWSAKTISRIHKDRWQIELFFKSIKTARLKQYGVTSRSPPGAHPKVLGSNKFLFRQPPRGRWRLAGRTRPPNTGQTCPPGPCTS